MAQRFELNCIAVTNAPIPYTFDLPDGAVIVSIGRHWIEEMQCDQTVIWYTVPVCDVPG